MRVGKWFGTLAAVLGAGLLVATLSSAPAGAEDGPASTRVGLHRTGPGSFSIDVDGADVRTVMRAIAEFSGRNIIVSKDVKATVTVTLQDVGWREAMRTILYSSGLDYDEDGDIIRVDERARMVTERTERLAAVARQMENAPLDTRIIRLNYANAEEMSLSLKAAMTRRGTILVEKRTNSMIISDLASNLDAVEKMAIELDSTTPQIEITAKLVDVDAEALRDIGIEWNVGGNVNTDDGSEFWNGVPTPPGVQSISPGNDPNQAMAGTHNTPIANPSTTISYGIAKPWGFIEAQLQVLEQNRKANIISNPRITTVDNREAKIVVGQKIPLIVQDVAGNPVSQLQTIGIQLRVIPHLTQDKRIIMDLHPEVSDLSTQSTVQGGIIINTSEADTRVMVDDGQTAVIGGLIRTNTSAVRRGIPLLKDLPLVGALFRSDSKISQNRELIIFVTPRIISSVANN